MRYYSEKEVARILYDIDKDIKTLPQEVWNYGHINLPDKYGRLIDADALCDKLKSPDFAYFSVARFESIIAEEPTILEAST